MATLLAFHAMPRSAAWFLMTRSAVRLDNTVCSVTVQPVAGQALAAAPPRPRAAVQLLADAGTDAAAMAAAARVAGQPAAGQLPHSPSEAKSAVVAHHGVPQLSSVLQLSYATPLYSNGNTHVPLRPVPPVVGHGCFGHAGLGTNVVVFVWPVIQARELGPEHAPLNQNAQYDLPFGISKPVQFTSARQALAHASARWVGVSRRVSFDRQCIAQSRCSV